jgi:hypothetical protein
MATNGCGMQSLQYLLMQGRVVANPDPSLVLDNAIVECIVFHCIKSQR